MKNQKPIISMERWKFLFYTLSAFLLWPFFLLVVSYKRKKYRFAGKPKILVIPILTRVGDLVCATPVFRAIKMHLPESHLSVLVGKKAIGIIKNNPRIDQIININDVPFKGFWGRGRFFKFLGKQNFDYVISLTNNPFNNLAAFYSFAPYRIKTIRQPRSLAEWLTDYFSNQKLLYQDHTFLQAHYLKLLNFLGISEISPIKEVFPTKEGDRKTKEFLNSHHLLLNDFLVGITLSAGNKIKEWPIERFAELADRLVEWFNAKIIFIDSPDNQNLIDRTQKIMRHIDKSVAATNFSLEELPSLIKVLKLFIAVDTGTIYVAHALGVPLIDILGPVDPLEQPPLDERSIQILPPGNIKPFSFVLAPPGSEGERRRAVMSISVDTVVTAVEKLKKDNII